MANRSACSEALDQSSHRPSGLVRWELDGDPLSGALFVFCNRRRTMVKLLYWDRDGRISD